MRREFPPMEELSILGSVLKRKRHTVPRAVSYWLFFKTHLLEKEGVRKLLEERALTREQFRAMVRKHANPLKFGPSFCRRRNGSTNQRTTNDMLAALWVYYEALLHPGGRVKAGPSPEAGGLGLFLREGRGLKEGEALFPDEGLFGAVFEVSREEELKEVEGEGYPSLYRRAKESPSALVCGPLALANHRCGSPLRFTAPRRMERREEFEGLSAVHAQAAHPYRGKAGEEIVVDYFPGGAPLFEGGCRCRTCGAKKKRSQETPIINREKKTHPAVPDKEEREKCSTTTTKNKKKKRKEKEQRHRKRKRRRI